MTRELNTAGRLERDVKKADMIGKLRNVYTCLCSCDFSLVPDADDVLRMSA